MHYLLFGNYREAMGGEHDFVGVFNSQSEAMAAGLKSDIVEDPGLSAWLHLAEFDGKRLRATHWLNIPTTEHAEHDELKWVRYE